MKTSDFLLLLLILLSASAQASELSELQLMKILNHQERWVEDKVRDTDRRPVKIMKFSGVANGDRVLDIFAGGGWYSELYSKAVGPEGKVYAHNDKLTWRFGKKEIVNRTKANRLPNVVRLDDAAITDIILEDNSIDIAFMAINYHDLFFTHRYHESQVETLRNEVVDYKSFLTVVKTALKDDGVLIIIDHYAKPGSGYDAANNLHRIDPNIVKFQLADAGFALLEEAFYLRNPNDDLGASVFDPGIRGKTDRFVYKFGKKKE